MAEGNTRVTRRETTPTEPRVDDAINDGLMDFLNKRMAGLRILAIEDRMTWTKREYAEYFDSDSEEDNIDAWYPKHPKRGNQWTKTEERKINQESSDDEACKKGKEMLRKSLKRRQAVERKYRNRPIDERALSYCEEDCPSDCKYRRKNDYKGE